MTPAVADSDKDRLRDGAEIANRTNPWVADSDNDGLDVNIYGTRPLKPDTDRDGLTDAREQRRTQTRFEWTPTATTSVTGSRSSVS
jgi:hypothetical protein